MFKDLKPTPNARGDERFKQLKIRVGEQIRHSAHFYATNNYELDSARYETTAARPVTSKATDGLYKRVSKDFVDVHENARKLLTGGKICQDKLEIQTTRHGEFQ